MPDETSFAALAQRMAEDGATINAALARVVSVMAERFTEILAPLIPLLNPGYPYRVGDPVPPECRIVRPARGSTTWLAWYGDHWRPVRRVKGRGFLWSDQ